MVNEMKKKEIIRESVKDMWNTDAFRYKYGEQISGINKILTQNLDETETFKKTMWRNLPEYKKLRIIKEFEYLFSFQYEIKEYEDNIDRWNGCDRKEHRELVF